MNYTIKYGGKEQPVLILLHGTGGNESSLLDVGKDLMSDATLIGIRGEVLEQGQSRFFSRVSDGVYDEVDLEMRANDLHRFISELLQKSQLSHQEIVLVGYSNGANIAIKLLLNYPDKYQRAVLFHPMYPINVLEDHDLSQTELFVTLGTQDSIVPIEESQRVLTLFQRFHANILSEWTLTHQLTYLEVEKAKKWLHRIIKQNEHE